jgi:hypothetical protein
MPFNDIVRWMEQSWLGVAGRDIFWVFPLAEIFHFFGLCLLIGSMLFIDLRLLGFARRVPLQTVLAFIPAAAVGLAVNAVTGIVFLCTYPENYWPSTAFRIKLLAIGIGVANALWFKWKEAPRVALLPHDADPDRRTKLTAVLSLFVWAVVIILGRFLPYVSKSTS